MHPTRRAFLQAALIAPLAAVADPAPSRKYRGAIIGHTGRGNFGHSLDLVFQHRPDVEVVAVVDPDPAGRQTAQQRSGARNAYARYAEMLDRERPDLVSIAMRHSDQHHVIGMSCLRANAHCFFEKPFTRDSAEADALRTEASRRNLKIAVAHTMRMMPQVAALKAAVEEGQLGEIREIRAYGKQDHRAGGEDLIVLGSHLFDMMRQFCGDPQWVHAEVLWKGQPIRAEDRRRVRDEVGWVAGDQVFAQFSFGNGVRATFTSDGRLRETVGHWGLELHGTKGVARINADLVPRVFVRHSRGWTSEGRTDDWRLLDAEVGSEADHLRKPVDDWIASIGTDRDPECSGLNGAWAIEMVSGIYASALAGRPMRFPIRERSHPFGPPE